MREHLCWVVVLMLFGPSVSNAQTGMRLYGGGGAATAGEDSLWLIAGGAEWMSGRKWGVGAEGGLVHSEGTRDVNSKSTVNTDVLWVYVTGDLAPDDSPLAPYLRAGASFFGDAPYDTSLGVLFGGGVNYWFKRGLGLRVDLRTDLAFGRNGGWAAGLGLVVRQGREISCSFPTGLKPCATPTLVKQKIRRSEDQKRFLNEFF